MADKKESKKEDSPVKDAKKEEVSETKKVSEHAQKAKLSDKPKEDLGFEDDFNDDFEEDFKYDEEEKSNLGFIVLGIIIVIIIGAVVFYFYKAMPAIPSESGDIAAVINGEEVTKAELEELYSSSVPAQLRGTIDKSKFLDESVIPQKVILQEAKKQNVGVSDEELDRAIQDMIDEAGISEDDFKEQIARSGMPEEDINEMYRTRMIVTKMIDDNVLSKTEAEIPEQIKASHILAESSDEAEEILEKIKAGGDFGELAKEFSTGPSSVNEGDLGYFGKGAMVTEFEDVVFALENIGDVSDIVKTQFGYHIIKLTGKKEASTKLLLDIDDPAEQQAVLDQQQEAIQEYVDSLVAESDIFIYESDETTELDAIDIVSSTDDLSACLTEKGAKLYSVYWCSFCKSQIEVFGDTADKLNIIECEENKEECKREGIEGYPTWVIDGKQLRGKQSLEKLAAASGC